jgi:hypothetical protein
MADSSSLEVMPQPLSSIQSHCGAREEKYTRTSVADALMLLSIISATAASNEYPMERVDSTSIGAYGTTILSCIVCSSCSGCFLQGKLLFIKLYSFLQDSTILFKPDERLQQSKYHIDLCH